MAKNPRRQIPLAPPSPSAPVFSFSGLPSLAKKFILTGLLGVFVGFGLLLWTDPAGQNWASSLSPLFLVLGYGLIGAGLYQIDSHPT